MLKKLRVIRYNYRNESPDFDHIEIFLSDFKNKFISRFSHNYKEFGINLYIKQKNLDGSE